LSLLIVELLIGGAIDPKAINLFKNPIIQ